MKIYLDRNLYKLFILLGFFACNEKTTLDNSSEPTSVLAIKFSKNIPINISEGFPKLQGNPLFFSDEASSYFYIQTKDGIGTFDLQKGGKPISMLKLKKIENFRADTTTGQNHFIPVSKDGFLYFDRMNSEIYRIENSKVTSSQKYARILGSNPKPQSGFLKFAADGENIISVLNMAEVYGGPPFKYQNIINGIGIFKNNLKEFEAKIPLPDEYLGKNVNIHDVLISIDYDQKSKEYIINYPILDDLLITKDFETIKSLKASPNKQFVDLGNRSGEKMGEWKKEYYSGNTFFTVYYDPFRELYVRHYRKGMSDEDYESVVQNSYKMLNPKNQNYLLFLDKSGNVLDVMDVSNFNHLYIHFGKEGMYILNDTELENEDSLTFSLFTIEKN